MPPRTNRKTVCVCVSNLPNETSEADIRALFSQYAAVQEMRLFSGEPYRKSRGFGYLDLLSDEIERVVSALDGHVLNGSSLRVSLMPWTEQALQVTGDHSAGKKQRRYDVTHGSHLLPRYEVTSVEKTEMPASDPGIDWYRYVLSSGEARITGFHPGTLDEVTAYATDCAEDFNLRSAAGKNTRALAFLALSKKK